MSFSKILTNRFLKPLSRIFIGNTRGISHLVQGDDLNVRYECFFSREDIDGWDLRQGMNDLMAYDAVPEPNVIIAALQACRRVNDYALSLRFLEAVKNKCGTETLTIFTYIVQEISPTLAELGCNLPEELCYHIPEFWVDRVN